MKRIYYFIILFGIIVTFSNTYAQQVISSTGGTGQNANGTLCYTIGELVIDTKSNANGIITQGFHQANLIVTTVKELSDRDYSIIAYPNPATNVVFVKSEKGSSKKFTYSLFDADGKLLLKNSVNLSEAEISFESLNPAIYFLKIKIDGKEMQTFKIIKK